jgi:hypothetical protein
MGFNPDFTREGHPHSILQLLKYIRGKKKEKGKFKCMSFLRF